eukprot:scaffold1034_cov418-Prasinococcus_capsulatus_cf.AAC.22
MERATTLERAAMRVTRAISVESGAYERGEHCPPDPLTGLNFVAQVMCHEDACEVAVVDFRQDDFQYFLHVKVIGIMLVSHAEPLRSQMDRLQSHPTKERSELLCPRVAGQPVPMAGERHVFCSRRRLSRL